MWVDFFKFTFIARLIFYIPPASFLAVLKQIVNEFIDR